MLATFKRSVVRHLLPTASVFQARPVSTRRRPHATAAMPIIPASQKEVKKKQPPDAAEDMSADRGLTCGVTRKLRSDCKAAWGSGRPPRRPSAPAHPGPIKDNSWVWVRTSSASLLRPSTPPLPFHLSSLGSAAAATPDRWMVQRNAILSLTLLVVRLTLRRHIRTRVDPRRVYSGLPRPLLSGIPQVTKLGVGVRLHPPEPSQKAHRRTLGVPNDWREQEQHRAGCSDTFITPTLADPVDCLQPPTTVAPL